MPLFDIKQVIKAMPNATTFIPVGKRGVGKSYSSELYCIEDAVFNNRQMVLVGRYKEDCKPAIISQIFGHIVSYNRHVGDVPLKLIMQRAAVQPYRYWSIESKGGGMWICGRDNPDDKPVKVVQLGVYTSVQEAERFKRGSYPNVYNIFFDEFITKRRYIMGRNEPIEFKKIVNTIARAGKDYKIFMAGNPDNEIDMCPYLERYNLNYDMLESGCIYTFDNGDTCFIKIAGADGDEYIVKSTKTLFGINDESSHTGEVDRPKTATAPDGFRDEFRPVIEMCVETSAVAVDGVYPYRRCFYLYVGVYRGELYTSTYAHRQYTNIINIPLRVRCKYEKNEIPPPDDNTTVYVYRFNFPKKYAKIGGLFFDTLKSGKIYHENDRIANVINNLILQS